MNNFPIIGIMGNIGSGKDTIGDYLVREHGFIRLSFAMRLREALCLVYDLDMEETTDRALRDDPHSHMRGVTPRRAMQLMGTEGFRDLVSQHTWTDALARRIRELNKSPNPVKGVVVTDVRFLSEAETLTDLGGNLLWVHRPGVSRNGRPSRCYRLLSWLRPNKYPPIHRSETELFDIVEQYPYDRIVNDCDIETLEFKMSRIMNGIKLVSIVGEDFFKDEGESV